MGRFSFLDGSLDNKSASIISLPDFTEMCNHIFVGVGAFFVIYNLGDGMDAPVLYHF